MRSSAERGRATRQPQPPDDHVLADHVESGGGLHAPGTYPVRGISARQALSIGGVRGVVSPPMALSPVPEPRPPLPAASEEPLHVSLAAVMERRSLSVSAVGSLLRAEGIAISRTRLHQLVVRARARRPPPSSSSASPASSGVSPGYFAEYRLWRARALLDPGVVGFDRAMANFDRLRGRRGPPVRARRRRGRGPALSWPGQQSVKEHA